MDRFNGGTFDSASLYGNSIINYDPGHIPIKSGKKVKDTIKVEDNILMNSSIKKVMQRNRELHKELVQLKLERDKIERERDLYKKKYEKLKR
tara:strand:- start:93 stop:368 length:276 start_codon:yes stop_codon:yes gene_type:complete